VNGNGREIALSQDLVKLNGSFDLRDENDNLVEEKIIQKISELLGLLVFTDVDVVLKNTFKDKLSLIIDENFFRLKRIR